MNKKITIVLIISVCTILFVTYFSNVFESKTTINQEENQEELYHDIIVTLISPQIHKAILDYYGKEYSFDLWDIKILSIERPKGERTFEFVIKIQVAPFTGPHNSIGIDRITLKINSVDKVKVLRFDHIKSYINSDEQKIFNE